MMTYNNGTCALQFPSHYVPVSEEEMTYVDGGAYFSASECRNICLALCVTGSGLMAAAATAAIVSKVVRWAKGAGGFIGWLVGGLVSVAAGAIGKIAYGIGYSAVSGRGVTIDGSPAPWDCFVSVNWN